MTIRPTYTRTAAVALVGAATGMLVLTACGSSGSTASSSSTPSPSAMTVTVRDDNGTQVLSTSAGETLYTSNQENGRALCTSQACTAVWVPLTVPASSRPTAPASVDHDLSTLKLQGGATQVTFDGHPLYTFAFDHSAGQMNGNGQSDSFGGTHFTWHAATLSGAAPSSGSSPSSGASQPSGSGSRSGGSGYGY